MLWDHRRAKPRGEEEEERRKETAGGRGEGMGTDVHTAESGEERRRICCVQSEERGKMNGVSGAPRMGGEECQKPK
eukprot:1328000-Rhodomonas_salina.1